MMNVFKYNQHFVAMMNIVNTARLNPPVKGQYLTAEAKAKISSFFKGKHRIKIDGKWSWV